MHPCTTQTMNKERILTFLVTLYQKNALLSHVDIVCDWVTHASEPAHHSPHVY